MSKKQRPKFVAGKERNFGVEKLGNQNCNGDDNGKDEGKDAWSLEGHVVLSPCGPPVRGLMPGTILVQHCVLI